MIPSYDCRTVMIMKVLRNKLVSPNWQEMIKLLLMVINIWWRHRHVFWLSCWIECEWHKLMHLCDTDKMQSCWQSRMWASWKLTILNRVANICGLFFLVLILANFIPQTRFIFESFIFDIGEWFCRDRNLFFCIWLKIW